MDSQYFSRAATWSRLEDRLVVHDSHSPNAPRMITMEPWYEVVFMAANGERTVAEFIEELGSHYEGGPPQGLREQVHEIIKVLVDEQVIRLHAALEPLPPYLAEEYFDADPETRKQQMRQDDFIDPDEDTV